MIKLSTIAKDFYVHDQKQWQTQNKIKIKIEKDKENLIHKIEDTLCIARANHSYNERIFDKSILKIQYQNTLSNVVKEFTSKKINLEIILISLLFDITLINNSIFEQDISTAYTLGHYTITFIELVKIFDFW